MASGVDLPPPPPPMDGSHLSLGEKTLIYWELMSMRNDRYKGKKRPPRNLDESFKPLRMIMHYTDPERPLCQRVAELNHDIIVNGGRKKKQRGRK